MPIRRLLLENYRAFSKRQEIELAPVTVVLGKNNSGKSALTRAPLVIATGFDTESTSPLDLSRLGSDAVDDLRELYFDQNIIRPMVLGLSVDNAFTLRADLDYVAGQHRAIVRVLRIELPGRSAELVSTRLLAERVATPDIEGVALSPARQPRPGETEEYEIRVTGSPSRILRVPFRGLLPIPGAAPELADFLDVRPGPIRYLGPYRERVARQHRLPIGTPAELGARGEGLPGLLAESEVRTDGDLLHLINDKLDRIVPGWRLAERQNGFLWSTVLVREDLRAPVNLADAGSGLAQVLPILAQCAMDEKEGASTRPLQIIEEPEAHLHPAAHAELADLYLRTAQETGTRFLIETHSETLLLRLRRRIAELDNEFGPETVAIYVVEQRDGVSSARKVELDSLGNLADNWPHGYFSQDYHEVRELARAQSRRSDHVA